MNGVEALRGAINASHQWYQGTIADLTPETANYLPAGTAHPISETAAHIVQAEDYLVGSLLAGQGTLWEKDGWESKLGIPNVTRQDATVARSFKCNVGALADYTQAVYAQTEAYFSSLKDADLDRMLDMGPQLGQMPVGAAISFLLIGNNFAHTGEIAAIKGVQGGKGYPF